MLSVIKTNLKKTILFDAKTKKVFSRESSQLELKESFNWNSKSDYAKTMISFANNRGGYIVFGISNSPRQLVGINSDNFEEKDESTISSYLNSVCSPEVNFAKFTIELSKCKLGVIYIYACESKPVVCLKNDGEVKEAEIYYRYHGSSSKIKFPELIETLNQIRETERANWMRHLENISRVGVENAAVLDTNSGEITGQKGTLIIDKSLIPKIKFIKQGSFKSSGWPTLRLVGEVKPAIVNKTASNNVRIIDDPSAQPVRLEERDIKKQFPLSYGSLTDELKARYSNFKINQKYHKIRKILKENKNYCLIRYLDPDDQSGTKKEFFSQAIITEFDKNYRIKTSKKT